ncbi:MAG: FAD-dependent oxidoreductase [Pseudonocardiaceae bacterium]
MSHEHTYALSNAEREQLTAMDIRIVPGEVKELLVHDDTLRAVQTTDDSVAVPRAAVFIFPRFVPRTDVVSKLGCDTDDYGHIVVNETGATSTPGVWAAGNVVNPKAQVITAAGAGAAAAMAMHQDLVQEQAQHAVKTSRDNSPDPPEPGVESVF